MTVYYLPELGSYRDVPADADPADYGLPEDAIIAPDDALTRPYFLEGGDLVPDVATARADLWQKVKEKRLAVETGGAVTPLGIMDSDPDSQRKVTGLVVMAQLALATGAPFLQPFTMADNGVVNLDAAAMIAAGVAVGNHVSATHATARTLRETIDLAGSFEDLDGIDVDGADWPSNV